MYFVKTVTFIFYVVFFNVFSMEETNKLEITKNANSISPLFGALQRGEFGDIKSKYLQFTKEQNREINSKTGNTFGMEVLATYNQKLQNGTFEEQVALLGIFENYLKKNKHWVMDIKTKNIEGQNFQDIFNRVKVFPLPKEDFLKSDFVEKRVVFDAEQLNQFVVEQKNSLEPTLKSNFQLKKRSSPKLLKFSRSKKEKHFKLRRSSSVDDIHKIMPQENEKKVILNPKVIKWVWNVQLIYKKISNIEKILNENVFDDLSSLIRDLEEDLTKSNQLKLASNSPNTTLRKLPKRQSVIDFKFEQIE